MTKHHPYLFRTISIALGLGLLSACQHQNIQPAGTKNIPKKEAIVIKNTPKKEAIVIKGTPKKEAIVIDLDLTQSSKTTTVAQAQANTDDQNQSHTTPITTVAPATTEQNLEILLSPEPPVPSPVMTDPAATISASVIELHDDGPLLPAELNQGIQDIYQSPVAQRQALLLSMAQELLPTDYAQASARLLNQIELDLLDPALLGDYLDTQAAAALKLDDSFGAIIWLHQAQLLSPTTDPLILQQRLTLKARAYEQNGLALGAAKALIQLSQLNHNDDGKQYNELIWSSLTQLSANQLNQQLTQLGTESIVLAWYELALVPLQHHDLDRQLRALAQWLQLWPDHPAAIKLPGALANLADLSAQQPKKVALALPLQGRLGKIGKAVVDGFMAARFQAAAEQATVPDVKVYDTAAMQSLDELYAMAKTDQIELIIGPLDKNKVIRLHRQESLSTPTLALNYVPIDSSLIAADGDLAKPQANLVQFGLAVEDEAEQLARRSLSEGHQRVVVLHQDQPWAIRAAQHFSQTWTRLGGDIASQVSFTGAGDHSDAITKALLIDQSHSRAKSLKSLLAGTGNRVKFEPRRRQDVDAIVLFALPSDGRQVVPTLAFHYAANLPVYASHHIYQGPTTSNRDRDLEKVIFTELPWLLDKPTIQQQISAKWPERMRHTRLFALGVDAYRLFPRIEQLRAYTDSRVHGVTGHLQINHQGRIVSQSSWGQFIKGKVVPAPRYLQQP